MGVDGGDLALNGPPLHWRGDRLRFLAASGVQRTSTSAMATSSPLRSTATSRNADLPVRRPHRPLTLAVAFLTFLATLVVPGAPVEAQTGDDEEVLREILFPVVGPTTHSDTWGACRGVGCSRSHKGVDIFGAKLAPLVAVADGTITSVRRTGLTNAGNKVVIRDDDGWSYIYLHLNNDSPGTDDGANPQGWIIPGRLRVGDRVSAGDVIGYLGDSGNAETTPNHLHFEIHAPGIGAINPTASVDWARDAGRVVPSENLTSTAADRAEHEELISAWYRALLGRDPSQQELFAWSDRMAIDLGDRDDLIADLTMHPQRSGPSGGILRAYQVALDRRPNIEEFRAWLRRLPETDGSDVVIALLDDAEFIRRHGTLDNAAFIEVIYVNARGRAPTARVREYWLDQLAEGRSRNDMAAYFVDSYGLKSTMWHDLEVMQAFRAALDRFPTDAEFDRWVSHLDSGGLIVDVVDGIKP